MTLPSREETTYSLIVEIARELYDRFVMGGWEPQDAYQQIREWLNEAYDAALSQSAERVAELDKELAEIRHELVQCDDVKLDQSLAGIVCEVQRARERAESENQALREALTIAKDALQKIGFTEQHLPATKTARHALIAVEAASLLSEKS